MNRFLRLWMVAALLAIFAIPALAAVSENFEGLYQTGYGNYDYNGFHLQNALCDSGTSAMAGGKLPSSSNG